MGHSRHSLRAGSGLRVDAAASDSATARPLKISVRHKSAHLRHNYIHKHSTVTHHKRRVAQRAVCHRSA